MKSQFPTTFICLQGALGTNQQWRERSCENKCVQVTYANAKHRVVPVDTFGEAIGHRAPKAKKAFLHHLIAANVYTSRAAIAPVQHDAHRTRTVGRARLNWAVIHQVGSSIRCMRVRNRDELEHQAWDSQESLLTLVCPGHEVGDASNNQHLITNGRCGSELREN